MSRQLKLTPDDINVLQQEFMRILRGVSTDGKISFSRSLASVQRRASLIFTETAWIKMRELVSQCDKEVGWHGIAKRGDDSSKDEYIVEDIMVYPQEVTGAAVTPDQEKYQTWLISQEDDVFKNIRMQGHSHVNMSTYPSGVDLSFYDNILAQLSDTMFYIFIIWNKRDEHTIKIYDMAKNILFETQDIDVEVMDDKMGIQEFIRNAKMLIEEKNPQPVTIKSPVTVVAQNTQGIKKQGKSKKKVAGKSGRTYSSAPNSMIPTSLFDDEFYDMNP